MVDVLFVHLILFYLMHNAYNVVVLVVLDVQLMLLIPVLLVMMDFMLIRELVLLVQLVVLLVVILIIVYHVLQDIQLRFKLSVLRLSVSHVHLLVLSVSVMLKHVLHVNQATPLMGGNA